jgi:hypothetical protein
LRSQASAFVVTAPVIARAAPAEQLAKTVRRVAPAVPVHVVPGVAAALAHAWQLGPLICVTGSIFLIGEAFALVSAGTL